MSFLGNLNPERYREFNFKSIKLLLQQKPFDLAKKLLEYSISYLYPYIQICSSFREGFLSLSLLCDLDWLSPLLVLMDYLEYYQDTNIEKLER